VCIECNASKGCSEFHKITTKLCRSCWITKKQQKHQKDLRTIATILHLEDQVGEFTCQECQQSKPLMSSYQHYITHPLEKNEAVKCRSCFYANMMKICVECQKKQRMAMFHLKRNICVFCYRKKKSAHQTRKYPQEKKLKAKIKLMQKSLQIQSFSTRQKHLYFKPQELVQLEQELRRKRKRQLFYLKSKKKRFYV
jgi:hypothetical protein